MKRARRYQTMLLPAAAFTMLLSIALAPTAANDQNPSGLKTRPLAPMVFTVNSADDTAPPDTCDAVNCTLREAILAANSNPGADTINFQIGSGVQTINLTSGLPAITESVTIDGTTQPGFAGNPIIELNGDSLGKGIPGIQLIVGSSTVRGLVINRFDGDGIIVISDNNTIQGNFIGTNVTGTAAMGNTMSGILINESANNLIGGTSAEARNVISGNLNQGVVILGLGATGNQIKGNLIGLNSTGTAALANGGDGIFILDGSNNIIGGEEAGARNVISANTGVGVNVLDADGNQIKGNYIGTDITGMLDRGNGFDGINLAFNSLNNVIGGATPAARNVIAGNNSSGIRLNTSSGTQIKGNFIGTRADGVGALLNNGNGIFISNGASNNMIGGTASGEGNVIASNGGAGVLVDQGTGNSIQSNSIFSNGGLGIDLAPTGVTPNDAGDPDTGPNNRQNFPIITTAMGVSGGGSRFQGTLNSAPNTSFRIEFFSNAACDASGNGEGQSFIGAAQVDTDESGNASFDVTFQAEPPSGSFITATATDPSGNTSEFSAGRTFVGLADLSISKGAPEPAVAGSNITFTITVTNAGPAAAQTVTVSDNLPSSVSFLNCTSTGGGICGGSENNRTVTFSSIPAQSSAVITITARVSCSLTDGASIVNTATVGSAVAPDPDMSNNSSTSTTMVSNPPAILMPMSATFGGSGGSSMVEVTFQAGCTWTATSNAPWIHITSGGGTGDGTVSYTVDAYADPTPRAGTMTIAGQTFTVNQSNAPCSFTIMPTSASFPVEGGADTVAVTAFDGCEWTATSNAPWITIISGESGNGAGVVRYAVESNSSPDARMGTITIAEQTFTVTQAGTCSILIDPANLAFAAAGGNGSFSLMTGSGCSWTAQSSDSWIVITPPDSGSGNATIQFQVSPNPGERFRVGTISVGDATLTVGQQGIAAGTCNNSISPTFSSFSSDGGRATFVVSALAECFWTATSNVSWVTINSGSTGLGKGIVDYSVEPNKTGSARVGTISVAGKTFTVKQKGN